MAVFKRPGTKNYICQFSYLGVEVRQTTKTPSKIEALAWEVAKRKEIEEDVREKRDGSTRMTLYALAQKWLAASKITLKDTRVNESRVRKLFGDGMEWRRTGQRVPNAAGQQVHEYKWVLVEGLRKGLSKTMLVHEVTQMALMDLKTKRMEEGMAAATINREVALVQTLLGYAASLDVVVPAKSIVWSNKNNRAASLRMPEGGGKLRWLRRNEEDELLAALLAKARKAPGDQRVRDAYELTMFLLDTGARYTEIAQIRWAMIDLDTGLINLYRSKVDNESILTLSQRSLAMLRERWETMKGRGYSFVFPALKGRSWDLKDAPRSHATHAIQTTIDSCGLNVDSSQHRVTPHTFRHTFASRLLQAGVSMSKVSKLLGHASEQTTQIYAHLSVEAAGSEAARVLDRLHSEKPPQGDNPTKNNVTPIFRHTSTSHRVGAVM